MEMENKYANRSKHVNISMIKTFARKLPPSALRTVILVEEDIVDVERFMNLVQLWLKLARLILEEAPYGQS